MRLTKVLVLTLVIGSLGSSVTPCALAQDVVDAGPSTGPVYSRIPPSEMVALLPPPPAPDSAAVNRELQRLHKLQNSSASKEATALADSREVSVFVYRTVLGDKFSAGALPLTAALSTQIRGDSNYWNGKLKNVYQRPRPYRNDTSLTPYCGTDDAYSYPSGHSMVGYLEAMMLAEIVPEQRKAIFLRADDYAHNRWVCAAHYPSDTIMAHQIAATIFGIMLADPAFQEKLAAARTETRRHLGLPELQSEQ
jgi:acid phosphatase (class A)